MDRINIISVGPGTPEAHLETEIVGNAAGLIRLMRPAVNEHGSGGVIYIVSTPLRRQGASVVSGSLRIAG